MTRNLRRRAALLALPFVLTFGLAACGDDATEKSSASDKPSASSTPAPSEPTSDSSISADDIPDPRTDPDAFEEYLTGIYEESGLSQAQASCMSKAFMDNVDVENLDDEAAVTSAMGDEKLQKAVVACMS